jgi:excisionase family DNA binding protein
LIGWARQQRQQPQTDTHTSLSCRYGFQSLQAAANWRQIPWSTLRKAIERGELAATKVGRRWRVAYVALDPWQEQWERTRRRRVRRRPRWV